MTRFERWAIWSTSVATFATGVIYLWMKYLLVSSDPFALANHPWQAYVLKLHILAAPLLTFSVGLVALRHVWRHVTTHVESGRRSGLLTAVVLGPMILTGYLIQAITHAGWLKAMAISHIVLGLLFGVGLVAHQFAAGGAAARAERAEARRLRRRQRRRQAHLQGTGERLPQQEA
jgi:hypothetical protein